MVLYAAGLLTSTCQHCKCSSCGLWCNSNGCSCTEFTYLIPGSSWLARTSLPNTTLYPCCEALILDSDYTATRLYHTSRMSTINTSFESALIQAVKVSDGRAYQRANITCSNLNHSTYHTGHRCRLQTYKELVKNSAREEARKAYLANKSSSSKLLRKACNHPSQIEPGVQPKRYLRPEELHHSTKPIRRSITDVSGCFSDQHSTHTHIICEFASCSRLAS